jgi:hypothetical protein
MIGKSRRSRWARHVIRILMFRMRLTLYGWFLWRRRVVFSVRYELYSFVCVCVCMCYLWIAGFSVLMRRRSNAGLLCWLVVNKFCCDYFYFWSIPPTPTPQFKKWLLIMVPFFLLFFSVTPPLMDTVCDVLILILQASPQGTSNVLAVNWGLPGELTDALPVHNPKPAHDCKSYDVRLSLSDEFYTRRHPTSPHNTKLFFY